MTSAATIVSWSGAHSSVRTSATRRCTASSSGAPRRRVPRWSTRSSRRPSGSSSAMPGRSTRSTPRSARCVLQPMSVARPGRSPNASRYPRTAAAVERALLGLEILGVDERLRTRRSELGVRELRVFEEPVRHREAGVGGLVGEALAARVLACEAAPAHVVGPAQQRGRDTRDLGFAVHAAHRNRRLRQRCVTPRRSGVPVSTLGPRAHRDRRRPRGLSAQAAPRAAC